MASTVARVKPSALVQPDRGGVVLVHVEHRLGQPRDRAGDAVRPGSAPGRARCPARRGRRRPRRPRPSACGSGAPWSSGSRPCWPSRSARKKPAGSNHGSRPAVQVVPGPAALFGVVGEGPGVQRQPLVLVLAGHEGAQRPARPGARLVQRLTSASGASATGHGSGRTRPSGPARRPRAGRRAPRAAGATIRRHGELAGQRAAESLPPAIRVDDELAGHLALARLIPRWRIQVGVARDPPVPRSAMKSRPPPALP